MSVIAPGITHAEAFITRVQKILGPLREKPPNLQISIHPDIASELLRFIDAHVLELTTFVKKEKDTPNPLNRTILISKQQALSKAIDFVDKAFIRPRKGQGLLGIGGCRPHLHFRISKIFSGAGNSHPQRPHRGCRR